MFDLIILDLDGTLYDLEDVLAGVYSSQVEFLMQKWNKPKEEVVAFLTENHVYPYRSKDSQSATELFMRMGIDKDEWTAWRNSHFDEKKINTGNAVKESVIEQLAGIAPLVLLSSNVREVIERILNHIGINPLLFTDIWCSDRNLITGPFDKLSAMQCIAKRYRVEPNRILSIGDRYKTDIVPALQIGAKGILLKGPNYLLRVCETLEKGHLATNQWFDYYEK